MRTSGLRGNRPDEYSAVPLASFISFHQNGHTHTHTRTLFQPRVSVKEDGTLGSSWRSGYGGIPFLHTALSKLSSLEQLFLQIFDFESSFSCEGHCPISLIPSLVTSVSLQRILSITDPASALLYGIVLYNGNNRKGAWLALALSKRKDCGKAMFYGAMSWDPWLILSQIVCIQCLNYISLGVLLWVLVGMHVPRFSVKYILDYSACSTSTITGWCVITAFLLNAVAGALYLLLVVERARKCLDFTATMYIIHLFLCLLYGGLPSSITWWVVNGIGMVVMAVLGEWLCLRRELREIPIRSSRSSV